jgi:electron transfer flavoprotein-quinone oxidoreductase
MSIVTARTSVWVGGGIALSELVATGMTPADLLAEFKRHPEVRPLLAGGELVATAAGLVPLAPRQGSAHTHGAGYLVCGDAALRAPAAYRGGCDFAVTSGRLAGETLVSLRERGLPPTARYLREYAMRLDHAGSPPDRLDHILDGFLVPDGVAQARRRALAFSAGGANGDRRSLRSLARTVAARR